MISKITLKNVASYKSEVILETNEFINLIYGLNGTGKTQMTNFLQNQTKGDEFNGFESCTIEGLNDEKILVYNQNFIEKNFYEKNEQNGIFTLAKENVKVEKELEQKQEHLNKLNDSLKIKNDDKQASVKKLLENKNNIDEKLWEIKTKHQKDFERFFEGHISSKKVFADYFIDNIFSNNDNKQETNIRFDELKDKYKKLSDKETAKIDNINLFNIDEILEIEKENIFTEAIVGNDDSVLASLINQLDNAAWVKQGQQYIEHSNNKCPFCQSNIANEFKEHLKDFFNDEYDRAINKLKELQKRYDELLKNIPAKDTLFRADILDINNDKFELLYNNLTQNIQNNASLITDKILNPKQPISLTSSQDALDNLNAFLTSIQEKIDDFNNAIDNKENELKNIEKAFWQNICLEFKGYIESFVAQERAIKDECKNLNKAIESIQTQIDETKNNITTLQSQSVNIEGAIESINNYLKWLGIIDFHIENTGDNSCKIMRDGNDEPCYRTLSEGEKTLIAFLYFLQLCQGKESKDEVATKKIIVIDDPISSLSYNYVFDIAQLIKNMFFEKPKEYVEQIFIFTHHLYFFHELIGYKENYENKIKMFRIYKGKENQSCIEPIERESIHNEYESYWQLLRDCKNSGANKYIIPNTMRNILEYFLGFIKKDKIDAIKTLAEGEEGARYKTFYRCINRESHSFMTNIINYKDFDENIFFEAFEKLFEKMGHKQHYDAMMKA